MAVHMISYDLRQPGRNYDALYEAIKSYGAWAHVNESVWCIKTDKTCAQVRDHLAKHIDKNDKLIVAKLAGEAAWIGLEDKVSTWLKEALEGR